MPRAKRPPSPRVALCAAITFDGKLDAADPWPATLHRALAPGVDDVLLLEATLADALPPPWQTHPTRFIAPGDLAGLPRTAPVRRWLCLGGPDLFRALLDARRVHDLCLLVRPRVDARRDAPTLGGPFTPEFFDPSISCRLRRMEVMGDECFLHYTVARRAP